MIEKSKMFNVCGVSFDLPNLLLELKQAIVKMVRWCSLLVARDSGEEVERRAETISKSGRAIVKHV